MDDISLSIIIGTYNSDIKKTLGTLYSIERQDFQDCEIIVADDGSADNHFDVLRQYLDDCFAGRYLLLDSIENKGIICNLTEAVRHSKGKYVKGISPGDYFCGTRAMSSMVSFARKNEARITFGDAGYYDETSHCIVELKNPIEDSVYLDYSTPIKKVARNLVLYQDCILGASLMFEKQYVLEALESVEGSVTYLEDKAVTFPFVLDGGRIYKIPEQVIWYEYGSGISTSSARGFCEKLRQDNIALVRHLYQKYPCEPMLRRLEVEARIKEKRGPAWRLIRILLFPDRILFRLKNSIQLKSYSPHFDCADLEHILRVQDELFEKYATTGV